MQEPRVQSPTSTEFDEPQPPKKPESQPTDPTNTLTKDGSKLNSNFYQRTYSTIYMIVAFLIILGAGHFYCLILILFCNLLIFIQLNSIKRNQQKQQNIPLTKYINWYIFFAVNYYSAGMFIAHKIPIIGKWYPIVGSMLAYHSFICFMLMIVGFLAFVLSLKQDFSVGQLWLPCWQVFQVGLQCIICMRGIFGLLSQRFQLLRMIFSPTLSDISLENTNLLHYRLRKHGRGIWVAHFLPFYFRQSQYLSSALQSIPGFTCKVLEPTIMPFSYPTCTSHLDEVYTGAFSALIPFQITILQAHCLILSLFASTIGPFGGFFASGLKRAIKIKDFANSIPGHGGVSDRMDCQIIMGAFTYFYVHTFVRSLFSESITFWLTLLSPSQQVLLYEVLGKKLTQQGLL